MRTDAHVVMQLSNTDTRTANWKDPAPPLAMAAEMGGLEYIRAIFDGRLIAERAGKVLPLGRDRAEDAA